MTKNIDRLYELLPAFYRIKDAERGYSLRAFLRIISEQVEVLEDDIDQLYDNWFIETCQDWVVPYIGDLLGYHLIHDLRQMTDKAATQGQEYKKILAPRLEVANTIKYRRQKGTLGLLDVLIKDITGWPSYSVELRKSLGFIQNINHLQMDLGNTVDLEKTEALNRLYSPFNDIAHTAALKTFDNDNLTSYNIPGVGVFIWRLKDYSVTMTPAFGVKGAGAHFYTFSALGNDIPLITHPDTNSAIDELRYPMPIKRWALEAHKKDYYGIGKSLQIWIGDSQIEADQILAKDLSKWICPIDNGQVAVDPELGRIAFPSGANVADVKVSYYYASCSDIGGGEYDRRLSQPEGCKLYQVGRGKIKTISDAYLQWQKDKETEKAKSSGDKKVLKNAVIEIVDSGIYNEAIEISLGKNESMQIRAANRVRPILRSIDEKTKDLSILEVSGLEGGNLTIDGLMIASKGIRIEGDVSRVTIKHSTLVPPSGKHIHHQGKQDFPSLQLFDTQARIYVNQSILGPIEIIHDRFLTDPNSLHISNSVVDAGDINNHAVSSKDSFLANIQMTISRSTIIGAVGVHAIQLAEDSIFYGKVKVGRRQFGCMRFCYILPGSRTPRRYECQPDVAIMNAEKEIKMRAKGQNIEVTDEELSVLKRILEDRIMPRFTSRLFGKPAYCQLSADCAPEIKQGAEDESEMGVFHDLYQPQRESSLRVRLEEYTPAEVEMDFVFIS